MCWNWLVLSNNVGLGLAFVNFKFDWNVDALLSSSCIKGRFEVPNYQNSNHSSQLWPFDLFLWATTKKAYTTNLSTSEQILESKTHIFTNIFIQNVTKYCLKFIDVAIICFPLIRTTFKNVKESMQITS